MFEKLEEIIKLICKNKEKAEIKVEIDSNLRNDFGFDSLDLAELTVRIENEFKIDVFEDGLVYTVKEILKKLDSKNESFISS